MSMTRIVAGILWVGLMLLCTGGASGQAYPNKTIRMVTTGGGGGNDFGARLIAQGLTLPLGQQIIVDNRAGSGFVPGDTVSKAPPDGYTLDFVSSTHYLQPLLQKAPYDPVKDFSPITMVTQAPQIVVVHSAVAANSIKELIALAKAKPGVLNFMSTGAGSTNHLAGELFNTMAGVKMVHVPYKSAGTAITDLLSGEVQIRFGTGSAVEPFVKAGKLRSLAVTSLQPSALFPGLPTVAASGVPGYEMVTMLGVLAPAKTPAAIINRLHQEIVRVINRPDVKEKFFNVGAEVVGSSPAQFSTYVKSYASMWAKVIKDANIHSDE